MSKSSRELNRALLAYSRIKHQYPRTAGYAGISDVLRRANLVSQAEAVLRAGLEKNPDDPVMAEQYAWLAYDVQNWSLAHARWTDFRARFPGLLIGYSADAVLLRSIRRFDEAEELYRAVWSRWPALKDFDLRVDYAELAQARGAWQEASSRWAAVRRDFPDKSKCYIRDAANLRAAGRDVEAEALLGEAARRFESEAAPHVELAMLVERRGDSAARLAKWTDVMQRFPRHLEGYLGVARALFDLGRLMEADEVLRPAVKLFPKSMTLGELHARIAFAADEWVAAVGRWTAFRQHFPQVPAGYVGGVEALLAMGNAAEADILGAYAMGLFPQDFAVAVAWSSIPEHTESWTEAERRWSLTCEQFPSAIRAVYRYAKVLCRSRKWLDADNLIDSALSRHPEDLVLLRVHAECAMDAGDWEAAESRWLRIMENYPEFAAGWAGYADLMRILGRLDESATVLTWALQNIPDDEELTLRLAWTRNHQRRWPEALALWEALVRHPAPRVEVRTGVAHAVREACLELEMAAAAGLPAPFAVPETILASQAPRRPEDAALTPLMLQFVSLGDDGEFGLVQRQFGAEPLDLLRWAATPATQIVAALDNRLRGIGGAEHTTVEARSGEYVTSDKRYGMRCPSFIPVSAEPLERFRPRYLECLQYLRRKLILDLEAGEKIFVYKSAGGLSERVARRLHTAVRSFNAGAVLLCVTLNDESHLPGSVVWLEEGLCLGFLDRHATDVDFATWVALCRQAKEPPRRADSERSTLHVA